MITQQKIDKLKMITEKVFSAASMIEGHPGQVLKDGVRTIRSEVTEIEKLWQAGQQPDPNSFTGVNEAQKSPWLPLVIHNMEFWQMGYLGSGSGLSKGYLRKSEGDFTVGVDTFELSLNRIEDTMLCTALMAKITALLNGSINSEAILSRVFVHWSNLMLVEDMGQRTECQEALTQFVSRVTEKISRPLQANVDGVDLFILNQPAHV